jgi:LPS export ABC transporter protein LptC
MKFHSTIKFYRIPAVIFAAGILFSCVNDMNTIEKVTFDDKSPDEVAVDLELIYTDSGYAQVKIYAALAETYTQPKKVTKLKDGLKVDFFSDQGQVLSTLTALYGEVDHTTGLIFVRDSVVLHNYGKNQFLETEELYYNQRDSSIYTDRNVIVRRNGKVGTGKGIRTTQSFSRYTVIEPVGEIAVSDSE